MKQLFLLILVILVGFSQLMTLRGSSVGVGESTPVIIWTTDANPARKDQITLFRSWLKKNNYPDIRVNLDVANNAQQKVLIQGMTGVAGDLIDTGSGAIPFISETGMLADLTSIEAEFMIPTPSFNVGISNDIFINQIRYGYSANVYMSAWLVNKDAFTKLGLPIPSFRNSFEDFERFGKEYVRRANEGRKYQDRFLVDQFDINTIRRSLGVGTWNETLTKTTFDDPRISKATELLRKWTYVDHLLPTEADVQSAAANQGYGSASYQLFHGGFYAMIQSGRHALIQLRKMPPKNLTVIEPPNGGFPNVQMGTRAVTMYNGSSKKEYAKYFLAFLTSPDYNQQIIDDADSQPPVPFFQTTESYLHPKDFPNENDVHGNYAKVGEIGIGGEFSPFLPRMGNAANNAGKSALTGIIPIEKAFKEIQPIYLEMIRNYVEAHDNLKVRYAEALKRQAIIDEAKAKGEKIPLALVDNPFLKRYYKEKNLGQ